MTPDEVWAVILEELALGAAEELTEDEKDEADREMDLLEEAWDD